MLWLVCFTFHHQSSLEVFVSRGNGGASLQKKQKEQGWDQKWTEEIFSFHMSKMKHESPAAFGTCVYLNLGEQVVLHQQVAIDYFLHVVGTDACSFSSERVKERLVTRPCPLTSAFSVSLQTSFFSCLLRHIWPQNKPFLCYASSYSCSQWFKGVEIHLSAVAPSSFATVFIFSVRCDWWQEILWQHF